MQDNWEGTHGSSESRLGGGVAGRRVGPQWRCSGGLRGAPQLAGTVVSSDPAQPGLAQAQRTEYNLR